MIKVNESSWMGAGVQVVKAQLKAKLPLRNLAQLVS